jgi:hypothetical protein
MAGRNAKINKNPIIGTDFQLHKTQLDKFSGIQHKIIDFTEHRLKKYISITHNEEQKDVLNDLLNKYVKGHVAISWKAGIPHWLKVIKDC